MILLTEVFHIFSLYSGLKPNKFKCEIAGIGTLKGAKVALCGMECINLNENTIKILGIHYSYDKILENEKNLKKHILNIEGILKIRRLRNLT